MTFYGGVGGWESGFATRDHNSVWIPGDWGYILNDSAHTLDKDANGEWKHRDDRVWEDGFEGENIIHVGVSTGGEDVFWGHLIDRQTFRTMDTWFRKMRNWKSEDDSLSGTPRLEEWVRYPSAGLD